jgi:hypothetical protein
VAEANTCTEVPSTDSGSCRAPAGGYDEEASWRAARADLVADVIPDIEVTSGSCSGRTRGSPFLLLMIRALRSCCSLDVRRRAQERLTWRWNFAAMGAMVMLARSCPVAA